jgi:hypothetical protein
MKAAFTAVRSGRKLKEIGWQFDFCEAALRKRLKLNLTRGQKNGKKNSFY